jgi:MraZ protein
MVDDGDKWGQNGEAGGDDPFSLGMAGERELKAGKSVQHVFVGVHERQLDERGRVALPTQFRSDIGEQCYLTFGEDGCVLVMSAENFDIEAKEIQKRVKLGETSRSRQRAFMSSVVETGVDKQGRIIVDPRLRANAGIDTQAPIVLLGLVDRIEIWNQDRYQIEEERGKSEIAGDGEATR